MPGMFDLLVHGARLYPLDDGLDAAADTTLAVRDGQIAAVGVAAGSPARRRVDAQGAALLPGFIDCHTHAVFAGNRMQEHAARLSGTAYADIAAAGGGIMNTVRAVRAADQAQLVAESLPRVRALLAEGVTTLEIKSGYGLSHDDELKMLRAIAAVAAAVPADVVATFLGAHTVPPGIDRAEYVNELIERTLPAIATAGLATAVDIYVESIAFSVEDLERLFTAAAAQGLRTKVHAEQLSYTGAAAAAARHGAVSADHLEWLDDAGIQAMAATGMVAVLLPGAWYFLRDKKKPPVESLRAHGVRMAVASDLNPGTAPVASLLASMHMAATLFGLTPLEALQGVTRHAAAALGLEDRGTLAPGARADFCLWDIPGPEFLTYRLGGVQPDRVFIAGVET